MRRLVIVGIVLIGTAVIVTGVQAQRAPVSADEELTIGVVDVRRVRRPVEVMGTVNVGNFPVTQDVAGTVAVSNLPVVQSVAGAVEVSNLPVDADGNLRISSSPPTPLIRFAGYTAATFQEGTGLLALNRACQTEFPDTRVCGGFELVDMIPAPPEIVPNQGGDPSLPGYACLVRYEQSFSSVGSPESGARIPFSSCMSALGVPFDCGGLLMPVACCG